MATAVPMSSIRPQQREVKPLFSFSLRTHEQGCSDIKSAEANTNRGQGMVGKCERCASAEYALMCDSCNHKLFSSGNRWLRK